MKNIDNPSIDRYLREEMTAAERLDFEAEMADNPELRQTVDETRLLSEGIRFAAERDIRRRAEIARDHYRRAEWLREMRPKILVGGVLLVLAGLLLGYLIFSEKPKNQPLPTPVPTDTLTTPPNLLPALNDTMNNTPQRSSPIADTPSKSGNAQTPKPEIFVADPYQKDRYLNSTIPARRVRIVGDQKTVERLPTVQVNATDNAAMRCVFYGDRIRFSVPAKMVLGQGVEILELRGAGQEDGFYLHIGNQFFPLNDNKHVFDLVAVPKPKAFD